MDSAPQRGEKDKMYDATFNPFQVNKEVNNISKTMSVKLDLAQLLKNNN